MFGLTAILAAFLPSWRRRSVVIGVAFSAATLVLLLLAWLLRHQLEPAGWSDAEWSGWLFYISPFGIAVQFGIGVVAYRMSLLPLLENQARIAGNLGAAGIAAVYLLCVAGIIREQVPQALLSGLSTGLLMVGALSSSVVNRFLSRPGIIYVGTISYSLYLFHFVVPPIVFHGQFQTFDLMAAAYYAANFIVSFALAIMLAAGVYRLVEGPRMRATRAAADRSP